MANYYATARSNYFAVKDETAFRNWAIASNLKVIDSGHQDQVGDGMVRFGITPQDWIDSGWPTCIHNEETEEEREVSIIDELADHLADNEVAVLVEIGNEKLRYLNGVAMAINNKGEYESVDLNLIYNLAKPLGSTLTYAEH